LGRLELPLPELGRGAQFIASSAEEMERRIISQVPEEFKRSIRVRPFKRRGTSGLEIEYDDKAESFVYSAIEYPRREGRE